MNGTAGDARPLAEQITGLLARGAVACLATLVQPPNKQTEVGAKLLVEQTGPRTGTLGDEAFDELVAARAQQFLASRAEAATFDAADLLKTEDPAHVPEAWRGARVLFERVEPEQHVVVCGAGHVGAALARLARLLGYRVTVIDDRADFVSRERFGDEGIELIHADGGWAAAVREGVGAGRGVAVAVVTRGHNEDEECLRAVLEARPDYVGMIGSRRRTNIVLARLREAGFADEVLREVRAPVGLDIGAVSPEEVALSILAEIVAGRRGGNCAPLSAWRRA
ncbi:MAG TPA: XdhC family protein [Pyrinomonadaceae bacterium]|nr:XdhC family protein [Pyrinomonadaceae bacterium]